MTDSTKARLDATRDAYVAALEARRVQDALINVLNLLAQLVGERGLREAFHTLATEVAINRRDLADAMRERDTALLDYVLTMYLARYEATQAQSLDNRDRIAHLDYCCRVLDTRVSAIERLLSASFGGLPPLRTYDTPPPGADDERESHP